LIEVSLLYSPVSAMSLHENTAGRGSLLQLRLHNHKFINTVISSLQSALITAYMASF